MSRWLLLVVAATLGGAAGFLSPIAVIGATGALAGLAALVALPPLATTTVVIGASFLSGISMPVEGLDVRPEQVVGPLAALGLLFRSPVRSVTRPAFLATLWVVAGIAGAAGEVDADRSVVHAVRLLATIAPLAVLPSILVTRVELDRAWEAFLACTTLAALAGVGALASFLAFGTTFGVTEWGLLGYVHAQGTMLEPNILGAFSAAAAAVFLLRAVDPTLPTGHRLVAAAAALTTGVALAVTVTRAAWVAMPVFFTAAYVLAPMDPRVRRRRRRVVLAVLLFLGSAGVAVVAFDLADGLPSDRRTGIAAKFAIVARPWEDPNVRVRLRRFEAALEIWGPRPWLGAGHGAVERIRGVEDSTVAWVGNLELHALADTGLLGLACLVVLIGGVAAGLGRAIRTARHPSARRREIERLAVLGVVIWCAQATDTSWLACFWTVVGFGAAAGSTFHHAGDREPTHDPAPCDSDHHSLGPGRGDPPQRPLPPR